MVGENQIANGSWNTDVGSDGSEYIKQFRMSYEVFTVLCHELRPYIVKQDTNKRKVIHEEQRVAVALYRVAYGPTYDQMILDESLLCDQALGERRDLKLVKAKSHATRKKRQLQGMLFGVTHSHDLRGGRFVKAQRRFTFASASS
ncbi:hypothetical protein WJX79_000888 [Trebouxia sp. C0005]